MSSEAVRLLLGCAVSDELVASTGPWTSQL
jgi:hypothetical protein